MVGQDHRLDGHEFEKAPGVGDGQGSLVCYSPWGHKESDTTEQFHVHVHVHVVTEQQHCFGNCIFSALN